MATRAMHLTQPLWLKHFTDEHPRFWAHAAMALTAAILVFAFVAVTWIATASLMSGMRTELSSVYLGTFATLATIVLFPGFIPGLIAAVVLPVVGVVAMVWLLVKGMRENGFFSEPHKHQLM